MADSVPLQQRCTGNNHEIEWLEAAKAAGVDGVHPCALPANSTKLPSASKMDPNVYLTFRSYWNDYRPEEVSLEDLGLSQKDAKEAKARLKRSSPYKEGRPLGKLPDLGAFTLVRHIQQQITNTDREDAAEKVIVTPIRTRSRTAALDAAAAGKQSPGDLRSPSHIAPQMETPWSKIFLLPAYELLVEPTSPTQTSGRSCPDSDCSPVSVDNSDLSNTASFISDHSAISMTAANISYTRTEDKSIVNTFLILLLNALGLGCEEVTAEWSMKRWMIKHPFGSGSLEAQTDGCLRKHGTGDVVAIVEVKPHLRVPYQAPIKMQETTQLIALIAQKEVPDPSINRFVLLSQDRHQVYLTVAEYDEDYIKFLKEETDPTADEKSFLLITSFGPWNVNSESSVRKLCPILLALTTRASK
ncbi:predicted protein [Histoplasma mississippiense (nom. inval.)]|uniref:predicted protein n=1 Tax=Ajellomyces capsulatus (strain NAm1 / WU24) TaxID=2059318 RepID=UPI000157CC45|nr:predicted protein [Histoplasma mississippiense (nom. inval.)]EDN09882.1 predicted protein [Histoplasma mississippiense (nom. inval.)]